MSDLSLAALQIPPNTYPYVKEPLNTKLNTVCPYAIKRMKCNNGNCSLRVAYVSHQSFIFAILQPGQMRLMLRRWAVRVAGVELRRLSSVAISTWNVGLAELEFAVVLIPTERLERYLMRNRSCAFTILPACDQTFLFVHQKSVLGFEGLSSVVRLLVYSSKSAKVLGFKGLSSVVRMKIQRAIQARLSIHIPSIVIELQSNKYKAIVEIERSRYSFLKNSYNT